MAWLYLLIAGLFEIVWALALKFSDGFTRPWPSATVVVAMAVSLWLLARALRVLPVSTGYAVWTGIGAAGTALLGMYVLGEPRGMVRLASVGLILAGIVGLRLSES